MGYSVCAAVGLSERADRLPAYQLEWIGRLVEVGTLASPAEIHDGNREGARKFVLKALFIDG